MKYNLIRLVGVACSLSTFSVGALHAREKHAATKTVSPPPKPVPLNVVEATIPEMRTAMQSGRLTSRELVTQYLTRIGLYEDKLHAVITVNPNARSEADERDRERAAGRIRGPCMAFPSRLKTIF